MRIIIFGTGSCCKDTLSKLDYDKVKIVGFCDNNEEKQGSYFNGTIIYSPEELLRIEFDMILIASQYSIEIIDQLITLGISHRKILPILHDCYTKQLNDLYSNKYKNIQKKSQVNKREKKRIALLKVNNSGSNTLALYKNMPNYIKEKYEVIVVDREYLNKDNDFDLICNTSMSGVYSSSIINVQLWHGFPLKKIGTRTELFYNSYNEKIRQYTDKIISYSEIYSSLYNASFPNSPDKYEICGMPRNDLLFNKNNKILQEFFGSDVLGKKIIIYLPTYRTWKVDRKVNGDRSWDNIFGFESFNLKEFVNYLRLNNYFFICKLHHMELNEIDEKEFAEYSDVLRILKEEELVANNLDLYEILANINLLITDYSSVYFDMLLIDVPMIFVPIDIKSYELNRGFNLEPYDYWTPGPKVFNQIDLIEAISDCFYVDDYENKRKELKDIVHKYKDDKSSIRVWKLLDNLLEEQNE